MEHIIQLGISLDDEQIKECIAQKAEAKIIDELRANIKDAMFKRDYFGRLTNDPSELVVEELRSFLKENRDAIIDMAAKELAEKMAKTKAVKEAAARVIKKEA